MAFTRFSNAEGGTNGTAVSVANSGTSGYAFDSDNQQWPVYSNAVAQSGSLCYQFTATTTLVSGVYWNTPTLTENLWTRCWLNFAATPVGSWVVEVVTVSSGVARIGFTATGLLNIYGGAGPQVTGTYTYAANTWYRAEAQVSYATSTITARMYDNLGNLLETVSATSTTPWTPFTSAQFGYLAAAVSGTTTVYMDNLAVSDQGWIGPNTSFTLAKNANGGEVTNNGLALTVANSGSVFGGIQSDAIDVLSGTGLSYSNAQLDFGPLSYLSVASGWSEWDTPGTSTVMYARTYVYFNSFSAQDTPLLIYGDASAHSALLYHLASNGHWNVTVSGTAGIAGTTTPVINTWYRIEMGVTFNATTAQATARIYNAAGTLLETITTPATGTLAVPQWARWGQGSPYACSYYLSSVAGSDQGWLGPDTTIYPTVVYGADTGLGTDVNTGGIKIPAGTDTGTGTDTQVSIKVSDTDSGAGTEATTSPVLINSSYLGPNLVTDPGFESGDTGPWGAGEPFCVIANSTAYAHSGTHSLASTTGLSGVTPYNEFLYNLGLQPAGTYLFSYWMLCPSGTANFYEEVIGTAGYIFKTGGAAYINANSTWQQLTEYFTVLPGNALVKPVVYGLGGLTNGQVIYFDDFYVGQAGAGDGAVGTDIAHVIVHDTDSGAGTDTAVVSLHIVYDADNGAGIDTAVVSLHIVYDADSGAGIDTATLTAHASGAESGLGTDIVIRISILAADSGTGLDACSLTAKMSVADSGAWTDIVSLLASVFGTDSGTGADIVTSLVAYYYDADTLSGDDNATILAAILDSDFWTETDFALLQWFIVQSIQGDIWPIALHNGGPVPLPQFQVPVSGTINQDNASLSLATPNAVL